MRVGEAIAIEVVGLVPPELGHAPQYPAEAVLGFGKVVQGMTGHELALDARGFGEVQEEGQVHAVELLVPRPERELLDCPHAWNVVWRRRTLFVPPLRAELGSHFRVGVSTPMGSSISEPHSELRQKIMTTFA